VKVLIAYDGSEGAKRALELVVELFDGGNVEVTVLTVAEGVPLYGYAGMLPSAEQEAERQQQLEEAGKSLAASGIPSTLVTRSGDPAAAILDEAQKEGVDLIVMGTRGMSAPERWLIGSVSTKVLHHARCSVLVARRGAGAAPAEA
jgi:nucleotide-binding universal stress UspA family protein